MAISTHRLPRAEQRSGETERLRAGQRAWLVLPIVLFGCGAVRFRDERAGELILLTGQMRDALGLENADLRDLRYYLSAQLVLERADKMSTGSVVDDRLRVRSSRSEKRVIVTPQVSGRIEDESSFAGKSGSAHCLEVSFEHGHPLIFCTERNGPYHLRETNPRNYWHWIVDFWNNQPRRNPQTKFRGEHWNVVDGVGVRLLVERISLGKFTRESQVLKGIR